ncbi:hypothetical protein HAX54_018570 [Datura stramonium]|uniref:Uncharacterized protein n=1 Tax=Datura stramonium TaxID=4076 RepID=A0ABS8S1C2_DATST|nr:hypothetical protein [Datura stramonium]
MKLFYSEYGCIKRIVQHGATRRRRRRCSRRGVEGHVEAKLEGFTTEDEARLSAGFGGIFVQAGGGGRKENKELPTSLYMMGLDSWDPPDSCPEEILSSSFGNENKNPIKNIVATLKIGHAMPEIGFSRTPIRGGRRADRANEPS